MTEALEALSRAELPEEGDDLLAGPAAFCAEILIEDERWHRCNPLDVADSVLHAMVAGGLTGPGAARSEIVFTTDDAIRSLNRTFRGKDAPTNVLAFPSGEAISDVAADAGSPHDLGSVALAYDVMMREADERGIPIEHHTTHLTLHGLLHLLGFDHMDEAERLTMEATEIEVLAGLGIPDPYLGS